MSSCPYCGSRVYRGSEYRRDLGKSVQVYRCNDLTEDDCEHGREPIARTLEQLRKLHAAVE